MMTKFSTWVLRSAIVVVVFALVDSASAVVQTPAYTIIDLGTLGGTRSIARDVNASGHVVGYSTTVQGTTRAFLYADGIMQDLGTFGGVSSIAHRITDSGIVVGRAQTVDGTYKPFMTQGGSQLLDPGSFSNQLRGTFGDVLGVNAAGQAVGYYTTAGAHMAARNRVFQVEDLILKDLGTFGGHDGVVTAINSHGHLVGYVGTDQHADYSDQQSFLVTQTGVVMLPSLGGRTTVALDMNDASQVVGHAQTADGERHAFLYMAGKTTDLGALPGGRQSFAYGINNAGRIVGSSEAREGSLRAVLFDAGKVIDLTSLIPAELGWTLTEARAINAAGQIVGTAIIRGAERAFLLTPQAAP